MDIIVSAQEKLQNLLEGHNVGGHNIEHMLAVAYHAEKAVEYEQLPVCDKVRIILSALLHDADDPKIFPNIKDNQNAKEILKEILTDERMKKYYAIEKDDFGLMDLNINSVNEYREYFIRLVIEMIDLVSCSKNGDSNPPIRWMAIPRDCDRIEAIGQIGIDRCYDYTVYKKAPFHIDSTVRPKTIDAVWKAATPERFQAYMKGVKSSSMIDHYYDKLLHIGNPEHLRSQNQYILEEAARRNEIMAKYVLEYWSDK